MDVILNELKKYFTIQQIDTKEFAKVKVAPMNFEISQYEIEGIGNICFMKGKALAGLMKMDTFVITPTKVDAPLFSYDRILAMGNDTFIMEFYDTLLNPIDLSNLEKVKKQYASLPNHDLGQHWYDSMKLAVSDAKKGKKITAQLDQYYSDYVKAYCQILGNAPACDILQKCQKSQVYVDGLLNNGGPATDAFVKKIGKEKTEQFFNTIMFNTKNQ